MVNELNELKTKLNERIEHLESKSAEDLCIRKATQAMETRLRTELTKLKAELSLSIDRVDIDKRKTTCEFDFKIVDLLNQNRTNYSPIFYCRNLRWYVSLQREKEFAVDYIGCYLHCYNKPDFANWSVEASFVLTLLAQSPGIRDECFRGNRLFKRGNDESWGCSNFIGLIDLLEPKNGFIKDQKIKLKVDLETDKIIRVKDYDY